MTKKEIIWREILFQAIEKKKFEFTQKELAQKYSFSLSTVFNALKIPRNANAVDGKRGFKILRRHVSQAGSNSACESSFL